jgi:hypothetical protein
MVMTFADEQIARVHDWHPTLANAVKAVYREPEVHEAMRVLGKYGLGVLLPHKHDEKNRLIPLPYDEIAIEEDLNVSFHQIDPNAIDTKKVGTIVGWRANADGTVNFSSTCSGSCSSCCGCGGDCGT